MYFDYIGSKDNNFYGIVNVNCDDRGINEDDGNIRIIKFWGTDSKVWFKVETSDYWKVTDYIENKENKGYISKRTNLNEYNLLPSNVKKKLMQKYIWEKLKI